MKRSKEGWGNENGEEERSNVCIRNWQTLFQLFCINLYDNDEPYTRARTCESNEKKKRG